MSGAQAMATVQNRLAAALQSGAMPQAAETRGAQLLARLKAPVSVVVMGPPGSGKTSLVNLLIGRPVVPEGIDLPVTEIVSGPAARTVCTLPDGSTRAGDGIVAPADLPNDTVLVRLELPVPVLDSLSLTEIRVAGSPAEQRAAVDWATRRADIVLWCTQDFDGGERDLWARVPETLKDHSYLVLTMADQLLMKGILQDRIATLAEVVAEEFHSLMPVATLHGDADHTVPVSGARATTAALAALGTPVRHVELEGAGAQDFGEAASGQATVKVHLPEPVLSVDVALGEVKVGNVVGVDVGDAPGVAVDGDRPVQPMQADGAIGLRQRPAEQPIITSTQRRRCGCQRRAEEFPGVFHGPSINDLEQREREDWSRMSANAQSRLCAHS